MFTPPPGYNPAVVPDIITQTDQWLAYLYYCCRGAYLPSNIQSNTMLTVKLPFTPGSTKTLQSVPVAILPALAPGFAYVVHRANYTLDFVTTAYAFAAGTLSIQCNGQDTLQFVAAALNSIVTVGVASIQTTKARNFKESEAIYVTADSDSLVGDGILTVYVSYEVITL
jgi:hypothetical protein